MPDNKQEKIRKYLERFRPRRERTVVIVDFSNVEKWKVGLGWKIDIGKLGNLVKYFTHGSSSLRRFYYGSDYGPESSSNKLTPWSRLVLGKAEVCGFEVVTKRVKYINDQDRKSGWEVKCDLDVEIATDLFRFREQYDTAFIFSGDGDLVTAARFLKEEYGKSCIVFGARGHMGREIFDAHKKRIVEKVLYAEDFEYRLRLDR